MEVVELLIPSSIPQIELPPQLITSEILVRLPIKSLIRFKAVSKEWQSIISSPEFARLHLHFKRSSPDYSPKLLCHTKAVVVDSYSPSLCVLDYSPNEKGETRLYEIDHLLDVPNDNTTIPLSTRVWGCSNGLVFLGFMNPYRRSNGYVSCYVWNPATRESCQIPCPTSFSNDTGRKIWGFGYVSSLDDYKIVCLILPSVNYVSKDETKAFTFSLKAGTWKQVSFLDGFDLCLRYNGDNGVLFDEMSYWIFNTSNDKRCIVGFDLASEKFIELDPPEGTDKDLNPHLSVIGGCLCFCSLEYFVRDGVGISMLKVDGGSTSWVKFYNFYSPFSIIEVGWLGVVGLWSGKFILWTGPASIGLTDMNQDPPTCTTIFECDPWLDYAGYYVSSLVSPFTSSVI